MGRLGEIKCVTEEAAQLVSTNCRGLRGLITTKVDYSGLKCTSDLIDPAVLLKENSLPLKLENGVITSTEDTVIFDTSQASLLELQITASDLMLTA